MENYLNILEESLHKKTEVLKQIVDINQKQLALLQGGEMSLEGYDAYVDQKGLCIEQLGRLDDGFELLYEKIAAQLSNNCAAYADQIKRLQDGIREVTELSMSIQAQETRNKEEVEKYFAGQRREIRGARLTSKAAMDYYQNMNNMKNVESQFMDKKK